SIPSAEGLRKLGVRTGLTVERVWTGEYPLETPIGIAVAARDYWRERRDEANERAPSGRSPAPDSAPPAARAGGRALLQRRIRGRVMGLARGLDPSHRVTAWLGRAAAIRGLFRKPS